MGEITYIHTIGMFITLSFIMIIGVKSGGKINNASDFTTGGKNAGTGLISGALISTLIGGSSTIGTAQLAFEYGVSAW